MDYKIHNAMHRTTSKQNKSCYSYPQLQNSRPVILLVMLCDHLHLPQTQEELIVLNASMQNVQQRLLTFWWG